MTAAARQALRAVTGQGETLTYAAIAVVGAFAALYGRQYGITNDEGEVGPGLMPVAAGSLLCLLGIGLLVRRIRSREDRGPADAPAQRDDERDILGRTDADRVRHLWIVFGLLFVTVNVVGIVGLVPAFGLFVFVAFVAVERRPVLPSLTIAIAACAFIQVVFGTFLRVPLPEGLFGA